MAYRVDANRLSPTILAVLLLSMSTGCQSKGGPAAVTADPPQPVSKLKDIWVLKPAVMRVYPTTRFLHKDNRSVLDAKIELIDEMGDSIKAVGRFRLELIDQPRAGRSAIGKRLYEWDIPVETLDQQKRHYDRITRTYRFHLFLDELLTGSKSILLRVSFITPTQEHLGIESVVTARPQLPRKPQRRESTQDPTGVTPIQPPGTTPESTPVP